MGNQIWWHLIVREIISFPFCQIHPRGSGFVFAPAYSQAFPELRQWALFRDFDCDGKVDIFSSFPDSNGVRVFRNTSSNGILSFSLEEDLLMADDDPVYVPFSDIPAIVDVDEDGDLDILSFDPGGSHVRWYENMSQPCGPLDFVLSDNCWGGFEEAGLTNDINLDVACKRDNDTQNHPAHAGSTLSTIDVDGDGDQDLFLGDLNNSNLVALRNGGTKFSADMDQVEMNFPPNSIPVDIRQFPASFFLDVSGDSLEDLLVSPNIPGISLNVDNVWYYQNVGTSTNHVFALQQKDFLQEEMIDLGRASKPVFFDYNGDGLVDIVSGNYLFREQPQNEESSLWVFRNSGTSSAPEFERLTTDYLQVSTQFNPPRFGLHPTFGDLDSDGDDDLVVGDENGKVHYFKNVANPGSPPSFILFAPEYSGIDVGADAAPQIIDLNRDGLQDLLIGERSGNLNYFENQGSVGNPSFASSGDNTFGGVDVMMECCTGYSVPFVWENKQGEYEMVVGSELGELHHYTNIDNNLSGTFTLETKQFGGVKEGSRLSPYAKDIDGDGKLEWVIGNGRGGFALASNSMGSSSLESGNDFDQYFWTQLSNHPNRAVDSQSHRKRPSSDSRNEVRVLDLQGRRARYRFHGPDIVDIQTIHYFCLGFRDLSSS